MQTVARVLTVLALGTVTFACASSSDDVQPGDEQDITVGAAAKAACGDKFDPALAKYKESVNLAKQRIAAKSYCEAGPDGEGIYQESIANPAAAAVLLCPAFKDVIKSSPYAAPIRTSLANNLGLRALTGELLVLRDSPFQNWNGVENVLDGVKVSTYPQGAVGLIAYIEFKANGVATFSTLDNGPPPEYVTIKSVQATYTVTKGATAKDPPTIAIKRADGKAATFKLGIDPIPATDFSSAPDFTLTPVSGDIAAFDSPSSLHDFHSFWEDCSI